jgi:hypothetical protein
MMAIATLQRRVKSGARNFYWIAALSIINSFVYIFDGGISFVVGLGLAQVVDVVASSFAFSLPASAALIQTVGIAINVGIAGVFALFGLMAGRNHRWAFIAGMLLYGADAGLVLAFKDFIGFLFHLFFLFLLFGGLSALGKLRKAIPQTSSDPGFPKNIGA